MKALIRSAIGNAPAMNTLMIAILIVGTVSLMRMKREVFPEFELEIVLVSVPYPGAAPEEIERGICQKIEEAIRSVDGIKKMTSVAQEGVGSIVLELRSDVSDVQRVVAEIRSEVDRIPSFPEQAEDAEIQQVTFREPAINIGILAPEGKDVDPLELRQVAERIRDELALLPAVSQVKMQGAKDFQIDIEIEEGTLRKHGLSLPQVASIVRQENLELPAGKLQGTSDEILLRSKNKRLTGGEIAKLPLITDSNGVVLSVGDLGNVRDEFTDGTAITEINHRKAIELEVERTKNEDLLALTADVREYAKNRKLPGGYEMVVWGDRSIDVKDRLDMLVENGRMGLILVFLVLAVFLELKLAFWVALGIPVAMLGAGGVLLASGQTLNMLSMFAFLMALGIVVDDAIVVGENIYSHRQMGKNYLDAAIEGTVEVVPSVCASVITTIIAFCPLLFVSGVMGKFIAVMPLAVIAMLAISLFESTLILPCHLCHGDSLLFRIIGFLFYPLKLIVNWFTFINRKTTLGLNWLIHRIYRPVLRTSVQNPISVVAGAAAVLLIAAGVVSAGIVPFNIFPKLDGNYIIAKVNFPDGTAENVTDRATQQIVDAMEEINRQHGQVTQVIYRSVGTYMNTEGPGGGGASGSHVGSVTVELVDNSHRRLTSNELANLWREKTGDIAGVEDMSFGSLEMGPGGTPIEFKLLADTRQFDELEAAVNECKGEAGDVRWRVRYFGRLATRKVGVPSFDQRRSQVAWSQTTATRRNASRILLRCGSDAIATGTP